MIPRASIAFVALLTASIGPAPAQDAVKKAAGPPRPQFRELTCSPAPAPIPAFKYSLIPSPARLAPGDGAPILLRLRYDVTDQEWAEIEEKVHAWAALPAGEPMPAEARALVDRWRKRLDLLAVGVRRASCDWAYPIREQGPGIIALDMPDLTTMRTWGRLQAVEARLQVGRGDYEGAARSLATGFALGARVAEGPFLINGLLGIAIEAVQFQAVEAWIAAPGSPNLYWALTELGASPPSLVRAVAQERLLIERAIPELADESDPTTPEGWSARLAAIHRRMHDLAAQMSPPAGAKPDEQGGPLLASLGADPAAYKRMHLEALRRRLVESGAFPADRVRDMPDDEAAVRGARLAYRIVWDALFRDWGLSFNDGMARESTRDAEWAAAKEGPMALVAAFGPALASARSVASQRDRRVALLRAVEAVRMHAEAHEGRLPAALQEVREAPVPADPSTGKPFGWEVDGDVGRLVVPAPQQFSLDYRVTIRRP